MRIIFNHRNIACHQITDFRKSHIDIIGGDNKQYRIKQPDGTTLEDTLKKVNIHGTFFIFSNTGFNADHITDSIFDPESSQLIIHLTSADEYAGNTAENIYRLKNKNEADHIEFVRLQNIGLLGGFNLDGSEKKMKRYSTMAHSGARTCKP